MAGLISLGRGKRHAEIFSIGRKEEYEKGFRFDQNILLNIPVTRARSKEGRDCSRSDSKPMHLKFTWSTSFSRKKSCYIKVSFILDSSYFLHSNSGEKSVEGNTYLFDIERVKLKKWMNVRLRRCIKSFPCEEDILVTTLIGLRDKPITQQDALSRSESPPRYLPGQDPLSLFEASPLSSCLCILALKSSNFKDFITATKLQL
ncbi:hypothetical protein GQ457_08G023280 [Hibiscus cannabinus]